MSIRSIIFRGITASRPTGKSKSKPKGRSNTKKSKKIQKYCDIGNKYSLLNGMDLAHGKVQRYFKLKQLYKSPKIYAYNIISIISF